jgi:hypothetical protein
MAKVHFFCELSKLTKQTLQSAGFGPQGLDNFNLTSFHSCSTNTKSFAMFEGLVRYQENVSNSSMLNVILQPTSSNIFKNLPNVKYIIYKGIKKDSILDANNKFKTNYTKDHVIHAKLNTLNPSNGGNATDQINTNNYLELGLGIVNNSSAVLPEVHIADDEDLDRMFFNDTGKGYEAIKVKAGDELGILDINFGVEVILEGHWRKPKMSFLRGAQNIADDHLASSTGIEIATPLNQGSREQITNYMDITALIGCLFREGISVSGSIGKKKKDQLYSDILTKFVNRNRVYIDIRNENNLSLNYYDNYSAGIQLVDFQNSNTLTPKDYKSSDWPLLILDSSNFSDQFIQTSASGKKANIELSLPLNNGNSNLCYLSHAPVNENVKLELFNRWPHYKKGQAKFHELKSDGATYTESIELATYQSQNQDVVSFYFSLFYIKPRASQVIGNKEVNANNPMDNLFSLKDINYYVGMLSKVDSVTSQTNFKVLFDGNIKYIEAYESDSTRQIQNIQHSGMYKTGVAIDSANIYFFAIPFAFRNIAKTPRVKVPQMYFPDDKGFLNIIGSNKELDLGINKVEIDNSASGIPNLFLLNLKSNHSSSSKFEAFDDDSFLCITMERSEYTSKVNGLLSGFQEDLHPIYLQVENQGYSPTGIDINESQVKYQEFELRLVGYKSQVVATDLLLGSNNLDFYGITNYNRTISTSLAAASVNVPLNDNIYGIKINHDPFAGPVEKKKYEEIR